MTKYLLSRQTFFSCFCIIRNFPGHDFFGSILNVLEEREIVHRINVEWKLISHKLLNDEVVCKLFENFRVLEWMNFYPFNKIIYTILLEKFCENNS